MLHALPSLVLCLAQVSEVQVVRETLLAKVDGASLALSPRGVRVAAIIPKGSRVAVVVDGVEGPKFDAILGTQGEPIPGAGNGQLIGWQRRVIFSADGAHVAYAAKSGDECVVLLDGKEVARMPYTSSVLSPMPLEFAPAGGKLGFVVFTEQGCRAQVDDVVGPWSCDPMRIVFSPDGAHYAYYGTEKSGERWNVVDGRQVKFLGEQLQFAPSGALASRIFDGGTTTLVLNGKPALRAANIEAPWFSGAGNRIAVSFAPTPGAERILHVDGKEVPAARGADIASFFFSPDGKRWAAVCRKYMPTPAQFVLLDGVKQQEYSSIFDVSTLPRFSADSSKFLYVAQNGAQSFVVVEDEESDGFPFLATKPVFSAVGSRLAWAPGSSDAKTQPILVDGKPLAGPPRPAGDTFRFSPDGARWAFVGALPRSASMDLVVDGVALPGVTTTFVGAEAVDEEPRYFRFSPDGKHIARVASDVNDRARAGMWVDEKLVRMTPMPQVNRPTFTPDSRHFLCASLEPRNGANPRYVVSVDGRTAAEHEISSLDNTRGAWEMSADGTLVYLGIVDGALTRFRIPPPADSNVETMLAAAH
ncbi:MAG: hypothetical protein K8S98_08920 [Planctomycetes bacterium]|nr:hypothetical protein [Planctomycetota bacterium]